MDQLAHLLPSFFIIGERKCGTSSLFRYLIEHPQVLPGRLKEPNFFAQGDLAYLQANWDSYLQNFPAAETQAQILHWPELDEAGQLFEEKISFRPDNQGRSILTGEASANTFYQVSPLHVKALLPEVKLLIVLREPVARAYSHYRMYQRFAAEGRELPVELVGFEKDLKEEVRRFRQGEKTEFVGPGVYWQSLARWEACFGRDKMLVLLSDELNEEVSCRLALDRVAQFLDLPPFPASQALARYNVAPPSAIPPAMAKWLRDFYVPHNQKLTQWLGRELPW
ncbi:MAG: sulfotransferase [Bacteroidota bacterium]